MRGADTAHQQPRRVKEPPAARHAPQPQGPSTLHKIKAIRRWCHMHTPAPESCAWLATHAITDEQIERLNEQA
ncbi:hypothetical protein [Bifidobacterium bohemicum]|uniref:hypothetical protein n=1 Tax=Bifidobacterium bohemicum TaxID=638617 RepID=UPI00126A77A0|nr:hypothetical protein [Bifidobacterium bohemicum]